MWSERFDLIGADKTQFQNSGAGIILYFSLLKTQEHLNLGF